jgi:L,D-transpeptidase-like protein
MLPLRALALVAALLAPVSASAAIVVQIDKSTQRMTVSRDGERLHTWPVSTGKRGFSTPSGSYKAFRMEKDHFSREWDDAPMPNSIFFTKDGHAIHGSYDTKRIGSPASHGCVRLSPEHAAILFNLVKADGVLNTQVVLTGTEPAASRNVASAPDNARAANARGAPGIDAQLYGERGYGTPPLRYQGRPPYDDQRYAAEQLQPNYGGPVYAPQPQPYYGSRYRDPYENAPPPYYRRGYGNGY